MNKIHEIYCIVFVSIELCNIRDIYIGIKHIEKFYLGMNHICKTYSQLSRNCAKTFFAFYNQNDW